MTERDDYESRIAALFEADTTYFKLWLEKTRGLAKDGKGRTVILGLSAEETEEFLTLLPIVWADDGPSGGRWASAHQKRYRELRAKHDKARGREAVENLAFWGAGRQKH